MENRKIQAHYVVEKDESFSGMITGIVTVKSGIKFINRGILCSDVIVEEGGFFYNHGMINGNIEGEGYAEVWGVVKGYVSSMLNYYIHEGAIIKGKKYDQDERGTV